MVMYQCGVDILSSDKLGRLGVSMAGAPSATAWSSTHVQARTFRGLRHGRRLPRREHCGASPVNTFRAAQDAWT